MSDLSISLHARQRIAQRGFQTGDCEVIYRLGETVGRDGYHLTKAIAQREICRLKAEIQRIERLAGCIAVICGDTIVTVHHGENRSSLRSRRGV